MKPLASLVVALIVATNPAAAETEDLSYDKAVAKVWGHLQSTKHVFDWCSNNVRSSKGPLQKAYKQWNVRFAEVITDINRRMDEMMNPGGQTPAKEFAQRKADLLKRGAERFANSMKDQPADAARQECDALPQKFESGDFDLEKLFASELRLIRQHER
jgi:hypothetical protein